MAMSASTRTTGTGDAAHVEPGFTLDTTPPRPLGLVDQIALWGSFGMSLLLPVAAVFVLRPFGVPPMSLPAAMTAVVVGSVLGAAALGLAAVPGAVTGAPAMVLLRGLFGRRGSAVPTALNLMQCVGWACLEVLIIGEAATRLTDPSLRPLWTIIAGAIAIVMAIWPLGLVRQLRRWAVWLVLLASTYLLVALVRQGLPAVGDGSWSGFWLGVDVVVALPISWAPLAADYARHSRSSAAAFGGAFVGYGVACIAYFTLGLLALVTVVTGDTVLTEDVVAGLVAVPLGTLAVVVLLLGETDKAFGNIYSTAMSVQNLAPRLDRRVLAVAVGAVAIGVALLIDVVAYENFLFLLGSVFVPLFAVVVVEFFVVRRQSQWDVSPSARGTWAYAIPWVLGFVTYQAVNPGTVSWWASWWASARETIEFAPETWMSASLLSFAVAAVGTVAITPLSRRNR
jgi:nucleobase:cation symporter-1, NCS1 family